MKLLADEGVDAAVVRALRSAGHDVCYVAESAPGATDQDVLDQANSEHRILLTADKDFGEIVFRLGRLTTGLLLLRLPGLSSEMKVRTILEAVGTHSAEMERAFTVVSPGQLRIRSSR